MHDCRTFRQHLFCKVHVIFLKKSHEKGIKMKKWCIMKCKQTSRDGAVWKLVGLITRRSQVQILLPQLEPLDFANKR